MRCCPRVPTPTSALQAKVMQAYTRLSGVLFGILVLLLFCGSVWDAHGEENSGAAEEPIVSANARWLAPETAVKRNLYLVLLEQQAREHSIPPELADAVAFVESAYDPAAIGKAGEIGIMQVMPATAAMLGFKGNAAQLAEPETNIRLGVIYLARAWQLSRGDLCRALMKYRAGWGEESMSARSVEYCRRARGHLANLGSPLATSDPSLAGPVPLVRVDFQSHILPIDLKPPTTRKSRTAERGRSFWAAHEARIHAITIRVHAKWARLAQLRRE
jgi:hypothetical protein